LSVTTTASALSIVTSLPAMSVTVNGYSTPSAAGASASAVVSSAALSSEASLEQPVRASAAIATPVKAVIPWRFRGDISSVLLSIVSAS
jgi:hypothetical protein